MNRRQLAIVCIYVSMLVFVALLRRAAFVDGPLTPASGYATLSYVLVTVGFILALLNAGVNTHRLGFGSKPNLTHLGLALIGLVALRLSAHFLNPLLESIFGHGRDLSRFADVQGSTTALFTTLLLSWSFAAFGEEIAFRISLLRGCASALGDTPTAITVALFVQAILFGCVHLYQGPAGVVGTTVSGLIFGCITLLGRGAIWPAALAHGANNTIGLVNLYLS